MELVFGIALVVLLIVFAGIGVAVGAGAEGPDPGPPGQSPLKVRTTRAALLAVAAFMAVLGLEAALVAGWQQDPSTGRSEAVVFLLEAVVDLALALVVLMPAWTLRRIWVLRLVAVCWLVVGPVALVITIGSGPLTTFYLGLGPDMWVAISVVVGALLVWLSSLGSATLPASPEQGPAGPTAAPRSRRMPPTRWRGIVTGVALASLVAISSWPLAQFAGFNGLGGCAPHWLVPGSPDFCVRAQLDGRILNVSGQTTLADGAVVDIEVTKDDSLFGRASSVPRVVVSGGKFLAGFDLSQWPAGTITLVATLKMAGQPAAVVESYGADGNALTGPTAVTDGSNGGRNLLVRLHFDLV